jgi:hypothetical protein
MHTVPHVISIRDVDYELVSHTSYHPAFLDPVAKSRILESYSSLPDEWRRKLEQGLTNQAAARVWAVVLEHHCSPVAVIRNLACTRTSMPYRRIYRIPV